MILIFSIAMDVDNSFYVKFIATYALTFFGYMISVLAMVTKELHTKHSLQDRSRNWLDFVTGLVIINFKRV